MPYVNSQGAVIEKRTIWRASIVSDLFWGVVNFVGLFITTLVQPRRPIPKRATPSTDRPSGGRLGGGPRVRSPNIHSVPQNCSTGS